MNFEEIKQTWNDSFSQLNPQQQQDLLQSVQTSRRSTALQDLSKRYLRFACMGAIFTILSLCYLFSPLFPESTRLLIVLSFASYFCIACLMDFYLYREISSINLNTDTVESVLKQVIRCRKLHLTFIIILLPVAFALIGLIIYAMNGDEYIVAGVMVGAVIGAAMGIHQFRRFMNEYKQLLQ